MPGSDAPSWRRTLALGAVVLALALAAVAARVVWFDPYWVFRERPPWAGETEGRNRLLDRQMRRAKTLQALVRPYETALLGSSTTYHGLDPALATPIGRANALLGSAIGRYAIHDAWSWEVETTADPGHWTRDGFRVTPKLTPDETRLNDRTRRRTTVALRPETYAGLEGALTALGGLDVVLYLSPVSPAQRRVLADLGLADDFARWRADMAALAARRGVPFHDLTALGAEDPFDPERGSTDVWLDNLHYTPLVGRQVLAAIGLRSRP